MSLNFIQKTMIVTGLFLMALVGLFPPWVSNVDVLEENEVKPAYLEPGGRHFLFWPPKPTIAERRLVISREIDYSRLILEWIVIAISTGCALGVAAILQEPPARQSVSQPQTQARAA